MEDQRSALEISPDRVYKVWNEWQIRVMVLVSLALQIGLTIFGNRRNRTKSNWVRGLIWAMYLSADSAATISLGILSSNEQEDAATANPHNVISAVWASFLLLHLGGPDTITAYSLEDNELWLRHLLGLVVQVVGVLYIFSKSQIQTHNLQLMFLPLLIFVAGIIKYGERTYALMSASRNHFKTGVYPTNCNGHNDFFKCASTPGRRYAKYDKGMLRQDETISGSYYIHEAFNLYEFLRDIYADILPVEIIQEKSYYILSEKTTEEAFRLVDIEIGFLYDVLYTKAPVIWYHKVGLSLRIIAVSSSISAFFLFWLVIDKKPYSNIDTGITYLFVGGAVILEIYSVILLIISDWAMLISSRSKKWWGKCIYQGITSSWLASTNDRTRWSESMGQYNLIDFAIKERETMFDSVLRRIGMHDLYINTRYTSRENVSFGLKNLIFQQLLANLKEFKDANIVNQMCNWRGDKVLSRNGCLDKFAWSTSKIEFCSSLIQWHIATDLCYKVDLNKGQGVKLLKVTKSTMSKTLSDYMIYLLCMNPIMMPKEDGIAISQNLVGDTKNFIQENEDLIQLNRGGREGCISLILKLLDVESRFPILSKASKLARLLQSLETEEEEQMWNNGKKWEIISQVWVEMLCYAACHCEWKDHAKEIRRGGELLTHVSVLMSHLGITKPHRTPIDPSWSVDHVCDDDE